MSANKSMIGQFREQQALQESSARLALHGMAVTASHEAITRRMELGAVRVLGLISEGKEKEAIQLMESDFWCQVDEQEGQQVQQEVACEQK